MKRGGLRGPRRRKDPKVPPSPRSAAGRRDRACRAGVRALTAAMKEHDRNKHLERSVAGRSVHHVRSLSSGRLPICVFTPAIGVRLPSI